MSLHYDFEKHGQYYKWSKKNNSNSYEVIHCECGKWVKKNNIKVHFQSKYHSRQFELEQENIKLKKEVAILRDELNQLKELQHKSIDRENVENTPIQFIKNIGQELLIHQETTTTWNLSPFQCINKLKPDYSGKIGELFINRLCNQTSNMFSKYLEDVNSKDGTYDINNKKIEIKTARLGKYGSFQHENLHLDGYDVLIFIDITPHYYYITILPKFDLDSKCKILGRKAHLRKNTNNVYKFDYNEKNIKNAIREGFSMKIDSLTTFECLSEFIETKIQTSSI